MGTSSFIMVGQKDNIAFSSWCHGAGRTISRTEARQTINSDQLTKTLHDFNITVVSNTHDRFVEEAPHAYQDVTNVVNTASCAHLARPVARMIPRIVIKD